MNIHEGHEKYYFGHIDRATSQIRIERKYRSLMINLPSVSPNIRRSLLVVDISNLLVGMWLNFTDPGLPKTPSTFLSMGLLTIALSPFIAIFPVKNPLWQRRLYIILPTLIIIIGSRYQLGTFSLNLVFLLKGCFLLPRREIIAIATASTLIDISAYVIESPTIFARIRHRDIDSYLNLPRIITNWIAISFGNCIFVLLLGSVWMEEQKSRQKAERLTEQVETLAADLERNRIARDIHDTLGHSLTSLDVQIELAQRIQSTEPKRAQESIDLAKQLSSQAIENVRQALGTMQRSNFDLKEAIIAMAEQEQQFQIDVDLQFPQLSLQSSYQLYCIVQESLTNIQKHAQADLVRIESAILDRGTILKICDNGKGFDLHIPHAGFGLRNMKERVQCLGGEFNLDSEIGGGTQVKIFIPASN
jgi:signal transduction histidine kinase